ncbi:DsrE family protein [Streptomyces millisiae]|uniref:DsrE family protein n=1 Tax=Streptomyces millisiae TaxID=3075542 RepID=A0ABU2LW81_9ACTN|nr:DsrE family protein [Streptomyces sp. DSM 44918]MDT0321842.1 DsrE family protein [Streptomyces sp. DSM 44918]
MPKTVIHVFRDDDESIVTGTRLAWRIQEVAAENDVELEVFCFGPAQRRLAADDASEAATTYRRQIAELIAAGVPVGACVNAARADGTEAELLRRGLSLSVARDEFARFTLEEATVITF